MADYPWTRSYPLPARYDVPLHLGSVAGVLDDAAAAFGDLPAVTFSGKTATYAQVLALAERAAAGFQKLGVKPGVHVGLYLPNTPHYIVAFFGVLKAGGTVVNYSPLDATDVLEHKVEDSDTQILVTLDLPTLLPNMEKLLGHSGLRTLVVASLSDLAGYPTYPLAGTAAANGAHGYPQHVSFTELLENDGTFQAYPIEDPTDTIAVIQYTGGTTGLPKGAMLTHGNITAAIDQYNETTNVDPPLLLKGKERGLLVLPLFHIYALSAVMLLNIKIGAELILHARFEPEAVVKDLVDKKITMFFGVPTMFTALLAAPGFREADLSSLKYAASGGAPLPNEVLYAFRDATTLGICEGWGMTETSPSGTFTPARGMRKDGSCGIPVPHADIRFASIADPTTFVPYGERGEISIKGPNVMKGYWKNPAATAEQMTSSGYFRTGDVGYMDEDGFVFIVDRIKDMLLCGGYNVYPRNIEEAIYTHASVAEVSVIGVPDEYRGETPKAFITLKKGEPEFTIDELKLFLRDKLGKHEMVQLIEFRESLPKTAVGKIQKRALVEEEALRRAQVTAAT